jgi:deazaflavin-dependent oxidoreductase (nitroreductase family)
MAILFGQEHVKRYQETDGREGHDWRNGAPVLLLTTTGRKSGQQRTTPLIYQQSGDDYVLVASQGGAPDHPAWFKNIEADPNVEVQVWGDRFPATARTATPEEKPELWKQMLTVWPDYDAYQGNTDRDIPVVVIERK